MAEKLEFKIGADNKQLTNALKANAKQMQDVKSQLNQVSKRAGNAKKAIDQLASGFEKTTNSATKNGVANEKGIMGWFKQLSVRIRAMHLHGIDPLTNKFSRFFSVVGGAGITSMTLFTTAIFAAFYALKKVNDYIQNYYKGLAAGFDNIIKISKGRLDMLKKEHQGTKQIVDELKEINEKEKIGNAQQAYADMLAKRLVDTWVKLGGKVDDAVKKLKDFRQIQAEIDYASIEKESKILKSSIQARSGKLGVMLTNYIGENSVWSNFFKGSNVFSSDRWGMKDTFSQDKFQDISVLQMFPGWLHHWKDLNEVAKIDPRKLIFGDDYEKLQFFNQVASQLTDEGLQKQLGQIITELTNQIAEKEQLENLNSPIQKAKERAKEIDASTKKLNDQVSRFSKAVDLLKQGTEKFNLSVMSDQQKLEYWKNKKQQASNTIEANDTKVQNMLDSIDWSKFVRDEKTGQWTTKLEKDLIAKNGVAQNYFRNYQNARAQYSGELQGIKDDYNNYKIAQQEIKNIDKEISNTPYRVGRLTDSQTQKINSLKTQRAAAQAIIKQYESTIDQRWKQYNQHVEDYAEEQRRLTNQAMNDPELVKGLKEQRDLVNGFTKSLAQTETVINQTTEALSNFQEAEGQIGILTDKLVNQVEDWISELSEAVRQQVAKQREVAKQKKYLTGLGNNVIAQFMTDNGQGMSLRRQQIQRELMQQLGVTSLSNRQKSIAGRIAYIEHLQKGVEEDQNSPFKYGVKTNSLAQRGGWASSVYVSGKDSLPQQQLKTSQKQLEIQKQIHDLLPELRKEMETLNKNLQI